METEDILLRGKERGGGVGSLSESPRWFLEFRFFAWHLCAPRLTARSSDRAVKVFVSSLLDPELNRPDSIRWAS